MHRDSKAAFSAQTMEIKAKERLWDSSFCIAQEGGPRGTQNHTGHRPIALGCPPELDEKILFLKRLCHLGCRTQRSQVVTGSMLPPCWLGFKCWKALGRMLGKRTINNLPSCGAYKLQHRPARQAIPLASKGDCYGDNRLLVGLKPTLQTDTVNLTQSPWVGDLLTKVSEATFWMSRKSSQPSHTQQAVSLGLGFLFLCRVFHTGGDWALGAMGSWACSCQAFLW